MLYMLTRIPAHQISALYTQAAVMITELHHEHADDISQFHIPLEAQAEARSSMMTGMCFYYPYIHMFSHSS